ncbi:MAG: flippase [Anaerolineales bacterium]|nr:MAG: flippase [Anaerolineales bacterium]
MSNLLRLLKNAFSLLTTELVNAVIGVVFTAFLVRHLSVSDFGIYTTITVFLAFGSLFADLGMSQVIVRDIAQERDSGRVVLPNAVLIALSLATLAWGGLILLTAVFYPGRVQGLLLVAGAALLFKAVAQLSAATVRAFERMEILAAINSGVSIVSSALGILLLEMGRGLSAQVGLIVVSAAVTALLLSVIVHFRFVRFSLTFRAAVSRRILCETLPIAILLGCNTVLMKSDLVILSKMQTMAAVGIYGASVKIIDFLGIFTASALGAMLPFMAARWSQSSPSALRNYQQALRLFIVLGMAVTVGVFMLSGDIVALVFGASYQATALPLRILIWALFFNFLSGPVGLFLLVSRERLFHVIPYALGVTVLSVALNLFLIPRYGYIGASGVRVISSALLFAIKVRIMGYFLERRPPWLQIVVRPMIAAAVMGLLIFLMWDLSLLLIVPVGALTYLIVLLGLGEFRAEEYKFLQPCFALVCE